MQGNVDLIVSQANEMEFSTISYQDLLVMEWQNQVKLFIDWFVVKYYRFIESRCRRAAKRIGMPDLWSDMLSESIIEAYNVGKRFDPTKGDILKLLISSLWLFPMRKDVVARVKCNAKGSYIDEDNQVDEIQTIHDREECPVEACVLHYFAIGDAAPVYSLDSMLSPLAEQDRILLSLKFKMGLPNTIIAALCGSTESTIRTRANNAIAKLQSTVKMKHDEVVSGL